MLDCPYSYLRFFNSTMRLQVLNIPEHHNAFLCALALIFVIKIGVFSAPNRHGKLQRAVSCSQQNCLQRKERKQLKKYRLISSPARPANQ
jgi:hypothetical protein